MSLQDLTRMLEMVVDLSGLLKSCLKRRDFHHSKAEALFNEDLAEALSSIQHARAYAQIVLSLHKAIKNIYLAQESLRAVAFYDSSKVAGSISQHCDAPSQQPASPRQHGVQEHTSKGASDPETSETAWFPSAASEELLGELLGCEDSSPSGVSDTAHRLF